MSAMDVDAPEGGNTKVVIGKDGKKRFEVKKVCCWKTKSVYQDTFHFDTCLNTNVLTFLF